MQDTPKALLVLNKMSTDHAAELESEIESRIPGLDLQVARNHSEVRDRIPGAEIIITYPLTNEQIDLANKVEWIQALNAGIDGHQTGRFRDEGIVFTNASGVHARPLGEQVMGYLLAFERNIHRGIRQQQRGVWERYQGGELNGKTMGIVGVGSIGGRVAELANAFDMTVIGTKRTPRTAPDVVNEIFDPDGLSEVLERADYVLLTCQLTDETRGLIGETELHTMKSSAVLINVARGEIVDEEALTVSLQQGFIRGAALDTFEQEPLPSRSTLWNLSNVIITPHMGGSTPHYWERCAEIFETNYRLYLDGKEDDFINRVV